MSTQTTKLSERARQTLEKLVVDKRDSSEEGTVWVVVLGPHDAIASRTKVRGRKVSTRELRLRLAGAAIAVEGLAVAGPELHPQLTAAEATLLDEAGFSEIESEGPGALERSRIEFEILLRESPTLSEAAKILGVSTGRLRQRLQKRTIFGVKEGTSWRLPRFQFDPHRRGKLVRGIEKVLPHIRPDAHPLSIEKWFSTPHPDLVVADVGEEEERVTPLAWLSAGKPADVVAALAEEI